MTLSVTRESAKIYAFPAGGRLGLDRGATARSAPETKAQRTGPVAFAACGYHEAALVDAERSRKS